MKEIDQAILIFRDVVADPEDVMSVMENLIGAYVRGVDVVSPLIAVLQDRLEKSWTRCRAMSTLGEIGDTKAVPPMIELLGDEDAEIRWTSVKSLEHIGDVRAILELDRLAQTDNGRFSTTPYARANVRRYWTPAVGRQFGFYVCQYARTSVRKAASEAVVLLKSGRRAKIFFAEDL